MAYFSAATPMLCKERFSAKHQGASYRFVSAANRDTFVAMADGSFARRRIELGGRIGDRYEVVSGLAAGEKAVVDGALFLQASGEQ